MLLDFAAAAALPDAEDVDRITKSLYLEARLGAKAAATNKKIGGGATSRVYTLGSLKFRDTLDDIVYDGSKDDNKPRAKLILNLKDDLVEARRQRRQSRRR